MRSRWNKTIVLVLSQGEQLGKIGPNVGGDRRASRLQQAEMVDNDDRIAVPLDVRQPFVQDGPAKQIDRQTMCGGGSKSAVQTGMVRVHRQAVAHSYAVAALVASGKPNDLVSAFAPAVPRPRIPQLAAFL